MTVKIANYQNQITEAKKQLEESNTAAIGFMIKEEDEDTYEE